MWILGNARRELFGFYGPALMIMASYPWWKNHPWQTALIFFAAIMVDSSHVYATAWRTWFDKSEMKRARRLHFLLLFGLLALGFLWCFFGLAGFWTFVLYLTVFHHIRQYYGVYRWSLSLNKERGPHAEKELYALTILPFIGYHFRPDVIYQGFFIRQDMWRFPEQTLVYVVWFLTAIALISLALKVVQNFRQKTLSLPLLTTVLIPGCVHIFCFLISQNYFLTLLPIVAIHGMTYYHLSALAQTRLRSGFWQRPKIALMIVMFSAIALGLLETWFTEEYIDLADSRNYADNFLLALGAAFITTPALYHYVADGFLWKRTHPDFKKITTHS